MEKAITSSGPLPPHNEQLTSIPFLGKLFYHLFEVLLHSLINLRGRKLFLFFFFFK